MQSSHNPPRSFYFYPIADMDEHVGRGEVPGVQGEVASYMELRRGVGTDGWPAEQAMATAAVADTLAVVVVGSYIYTSSYPAPVVIIDGHALGLSSLTLMMTLTLVAAGREEVHGPANGYEGLQSHYCPRPLLRYYSYHGG